MQLAIIEPVHPKVHGIFPSLNKRRGDWFVIYSCPIDKFYNDWSMLTTLSEYIYSARSPPPHPNINNYDKILHQYKSWEIIKPLYHETDNDLTVHLGIVKTFWLRILQKRWRKKHKIIQKRKNPKVLLNREITGKW